MTTVSSLTDTAAANIRAELGRRQWSQTTLADKLGWTRSTLSTMLGGRQHITLAKLEQIADVLEVEPSKLLND